MKKLSLYVFLFFSLFINEHSLSKEMATWGPTGSTCKDLEPFLDSEEGKLLVQSEIRGFLNGLNVQSLLMDENATLKIINHNSTEFALAYLINFCRKDSDAAAVIGIISYYRTLPSFK